LTDRAAASYLWVRRSSHPKETALHPTIERILLILGLAFVFALRAIRADQPIVENYVGRQIPTAMVARNLERGSGWTRPELDTGPFPNLFLVEPPIYQTVVLEVRRLFLLRIEPAGRLTSAIAAALGAWGLFGLARRREGAATALLAVVAFGLLPVTIRYGRAFQPDAFVLGTLLAALRCWDEFEHEGGWAWLISGWTLLAIGLAQKVIAAYFLAPVIVLIVHSLRTRANRESADALVTTGQRTRKPPSYWRQVGLVAMSVAPAVFWYWHAARLLRVEGGSQASAENASIWFSVLIPTALLRVETYRTIGRFLLIRAFTPIGVAIAAFGWIRGRRDRLWTSWWYAAVFALVVLSAKIHHEYYWLILAPLISVGIARGLVSLWNSGLPSTNVGHPPAGEPLSVADSVARWRTTAASRVICVLVGVAFATLAVAQSASTWRTPGEWAHLADAAVEIQTIVRPDQLLAAPEALLYASDRRGARWELELESARRAAREWGDALRDDGPLALLESYRLHRIEFFADTGLEDDAKVRAFRNAVRSRYLVLVDRPGVFIASLTPTGG
jgi:Dolichyl-phosphate-mannose-protein mannosyltransferase